MPKETDTQTTEAATPLTSRSALLAEQRGDDLYLIREKGSSNILQVMMRNKDAIRSGDNWRLYKVGAGDPYDTDQYRHDLLERNGIKVL